MSKNKTRYRMLDQIVDHPAIKEILDIPKEGIVVKLNKGWVLKNMGNLSIRKLIGSIKDFKYNPKSYYRWKINI